ncbi:Mbeg1-like protein [Terrabacter sp. Ter38]|uniref:Mbeg1-like protein n=1 Tax=Terrabacter sp. Ter38 TaxID=2926030 RepID=UPI0021183982|nr:Mbeg1-like protein [Terrabacter sp. Ter38]
MLYRKGADPEALERAARELTACATEVDGIRSTGARALAVIGRSWGGDDAHSAQESWRSTSAALWALGSTLESMSRRLTDNARAQRGTSGGNGLVSGPSGFPDVFPGLGGSGSVGPGASAEPTPLGEQVRGTSPQAIDLELAHVADNVYHPSAVDGWTPLDADALAGLRIDPASLHRGDGFDAAVYRNDEGQYVLAFAGTSSLTDWGTNLQQGVGALSGQHLQAIALAQGLARAVGSENIVITGHSLGGGLASTASVATDIPAVTFNAAGVHPNTVLAATARGQEDAGYSSGQIRNYHVRGELLTTLQNPLGSFVDHVPFVGDDPLPNALGTQIAVNPTHGPEISVSKWAGLAGTFAPAVVGIEAGLDVFGWSKNAHGGDSVVDAMEASTYFGKQ